MNRPNLPAAAAALLAVMLTVAGQAVAKPQETARLWLSREDGPELMVQQPEIAWRYAAPRPGRAVLRVELAEAPDAATLAALRTHAGVTALADEGAALDIGLVDNADAVPVLGWLQARGQRPLHFATGRASLEDIFLNLTGRSLRD